MFSKLITLATVGLLLAACTIPPAPQNRQELITAIEKGATFTQHETHIIKRPINQVYNSLRPKVRKCLAVKITSTMQQGYGIHTSTSIYRPSMRKVSKSRAEISLQVEHIPRGIGGDTMPKGGYFIIASDIEAVAKNRTKITTYGPSVGHDDLFVALKNWAQGKNTPCPDM